MTNHFKISLLGLLGISTAMAGGLSQAQLNQQDALINPYTDKRQVLEMTVNNDKVDVSKTTPSVTMQKWNGADHLDVSYSKPAKSVPTRKFMTNQIETPIDNQQMVTMKPTDDGTGFNVDVTLSAKPSTNVFTYTFDNWQDKDFFYQPPLNVEMASSTCTETDCGGSHRPENVVGSYAVYSKVHANHILGQTNYDTGKLFHIYRPLVTDANGSTTWASLNIVNGVMSVTVPQSFLDSASYPVVVDPTFGYTTIGASVDTNDFNFVATGFPYTATTGDTITKYSFYGYQTTGSYPEVATYLVVAGVATSRLDTAQTITLPPTTAAWTDSSVISVSMSGGSTYAIAFGKLVSKVYVKYDSSGGAGKHASIQTSLPSTWAGTTSSGSRYSFYATYTASSGVSPIPNEVQIQNSNLIIKNINMVLKQP